MQGTFGLHQWKPNALILSGFQRQKGYNMPTLISGMSERSSHISQAHKKASPLYNQHLLVAVLLSCSTSTKPDLKTKTKNKKQSSSPWLCSSTVREGQREDDIILENGCAQGGSVDGLDNGCTGVPE